MPFLISLLISFAYLPARSSSTTSTAQYRWLAEVILNREMINATSIALLVIHQDNLPFPDLLPRPAEMRVFRLVQSHIQWGTWHLSICTSPPSVQVSRGAGGLMLSVDAGVNVWKYTWESQPETIAPSDILMSIHGIACILSEINVSFVWCRCLTGKPLEACLLYAFGDVGWFGPARIL